jgi:hypothetical protein
MLFRKKSPIEKLQAKYKDLMSDAHKWSSKNRTLSDAKYAEADAVMKEIEALQKNA